MSQKTRRSAGTSFGATAPPFLDYLRDILRRYPDGGQILKELIQNADDARATDVVFIFDERKYQTASLWTDKLGKYQGPALYSYNNAVFTDDDWDRIQKAGRSGKVNDPDKIGRFGIGFNSVYHITDVPSIFSSRHLGIMDPQENIFGNREAGFLWSLDDPEHQEAFMTMQDQFQPFRDIVSLIGKKEWSEVVTTDQYFNGTIFRFPLRGKASEISDNLYNSNKMKELFESFMADAELSLLFLKNVTSVSLVRISADGTVHKRLEVKSPNPMEVAVKSEPDPVLEGSTRFKHVILQSENHKETKWLITTCTMKKGKVKDLDILSKKLSFLPRVDLAFPCDEKKNCGEGRLSCFLPLPNNESNKTGLPVCVNACFGLTDNRREIKWQEEDQKHDEHASWNELLVKRMLPEVYLKIIQDAIKLSQQSLLPVSSVYNLWPDITQCQHKQKWHKVALDVFDRLFRPNVAILSLVKDEQKFIPLSDAVLPCNGPTSHDVVSAIKRTLVSCGENLVTLSASVAKAIEAKPHKVAPTHVTPTFLRSLLQRNGVHSIPGADKLFLLEYILSDNKYEELKGLQLLPLSDGTFTSFSDRKEDTALIDSKECPRVLLPYCKHLFISQDLSPTCKTHLKELAKKKLFNVININKYHVAEYTRTYLLKEWKQSGMPLVTWNSSNREHPPSDWFHKFWKFLNAQFENLSDFIDIPLIPVTPLVDCLSASVAKLKPDTTLIFQSRKKKILPEQIDQLVTRLGVTVIRGNEWLKHEDLDTYVLSPSPKSVMKVLNNLKSGCIIQDLKNESEKPREELKDYLSQLSSISEAEKEFLLKLPLFLTVKGSCASGHSKTALLLKSDPKIPKELPIPESVIQCVTEADRRLLKLLEVPIKCSAEVVIDLVDSIKNQLYRKEETEKIMTWILQHGTILFSQNQLLKQRCSNLSFIEVNRQMQKPSCFFDPRIQDFKVLFESEFFPPPVYSETPQMLDSLTVLGLKNQETDITPEHFLHVTKQIEKLNVQSHTEALKKSQTLLKIFDACDLGSKFSDEQLTCLRKLKWILCTQPEIHKKQMSTKEDRFYCPDEIRDVKYRDFVGHVMPLSNLSDRVSNKLDLKLPPPPEKIMENLTAMKIKTEEMNEPDKNVDFKRSLHNIYGHMQKNISSFRAVINKETNWVWAHSRFVSPRDLVLDYPHDLDLSSYISKVPNEFLSFQRLLLEFGLKPSLSNEEIVNILHTIQKNIQTQQQPFASPAEIKVSIEILNWLWREKEIVPNEVPVPVILGNGLFTLKPQSETLFHDISKTGLEDLQFSQENMYLLHEEIPKATAEWLNIQFLSNYILAPELVGIENCGQFEPITMRIRNILKEYDEESDIFKELIQNAEDAGADQCKFMVDFRVHKERPESLIDPGMAICQGPCLWAFNNKQFSAEDWLNIVRVGSASKENKVEKIGKFGLGFNTVFHVTDVPSILSGNKLLILDPNVTHLQKHIKNKSNPGIKLDLSQKRLLDCFPGQFAPYESVFACHFNKKDPSEPYNGTLIKLPFRREEEAQKSEISSNVYHKPGIIALQQKFVGNAETHLIFLKNIKTMSLQSILENGSTPLRHDEIKTIKTMSKTVVNTIKIQDEAALSKQLQAEKSLLKPDGKHKNVIDSGTVNIVQITSQQSGESKQQTWLLYNCFGTDQALDIFVQGNKKNSFSLPIGGIAVPLQINTKSKTLSPCHTDLDGQAFCFLPLPIHTGLPVHVNGTFAVTSNRKGLWESGEKKDWNKALLQDPLVTAYVTGLLALKEMSEKNQLENYCYHTFWPDREKVSATFIPLVDAFYSTIAQQSNGPELLSDGEDWCSMSNVIFLHENIENNKKLSSLVAEVCKSNAKTSNIVVPLLPWLRKSFKQAGLENVLKDRTWDWTKFYREVVFKNLETINPETRDIFILHAIDLKIEEIDSLLRSHPCIPTTDGQLQFIEKLVNPSGRVACLFEADEGRLLGGTEKNFCSTKRIQRLLKLGMADDNLSLDDITKKAGTVNEIWWSNKEKAYEQIRCLLSLMRNYMKDTDSHHWQTLRMTEFLPTFSAGDIHMQGEITLQKPTNVFNDKFAILANMTHPVLDRNGLEMSNTDCFQIGNEPFLEALGVCCSPTSDTVLQQLAETCKKSKFIENSTMHTIALECYKYLDQQIGSGIDTTSIPQRAKSFPFILVDNAFVNVNCVAETGKFGAKPYLHLLPSSFKSFRNLWESVGIKKSFTVAQYVNILCELHSKHGDNPLPESDLLTCFTILNYGIFEPKEVVKDDCPIPNEHGVLQPLKELVYNDSPWMPVSSDVTLCHANISRAMACHLGIKTTRHHSLENFIDDISPFAFEFEQHEDLPVRIKGIISAYPSKKDILKELIQNADDAEATEIHFVWDKRQHDSEKIFGEKWKHLQGPALCVFNNKVFSKDDLEGIQQLGTGGKQNSLGKIGKYGVGFNSVYHLTDCPSILTGDKFLCISDPNQNFIDCHENKPRAGIGYKLPDMIKKMYWDVYMSFLPDQFSLKDGTMFRLPLRTKINGKDSRISKDEVTDDDMEELCSVLAKDPEGLLLFLKNIRTVKIYQIDAFSDELQTIFEVTKEFTEQNELLKDGFVKHLQSALTFDRPISPHQTFYETTISTSDKRQSKWIIAEHFGSFKENDDMKLSNKLPVVAIAAHVGIKLSNKMPHESSEFKGAVFCSLPLPGETGLPVHVNGNFEIDAGRKHLWKEDGQSQRTIWNEHLKENIIAPLYADLLDYIRCKCPDKTVSHVQTESCFDNSYLCYWPTVSGKVDSQWHDMIHEVYRSIKEKGLNVIPVLRSSIRKVSEREIKEYSFDWCNLCEKEPTMIPYLTRSAIHSINPILEDLGMKLVPNSTRMEKIWSCMKNAGIDVKKISPATVQAFLKVKPLNDPAQTGDNLPLPISSTLIKEPARCSNLLDFCLSNATLKTDATEQNLSLLNGLPLLLTRDNILRVFNSESPKLFSKYASLFIGNEEKFVNNETIKEHVKLLQTCNLIKSLSLSHAVNLLKPLVWSHLQTCEYDPDTGLYILNETVSKWLESLWMYILSEINTNTSCNNDQSLTFSDAKELMSDLYILPVIGPNNTHLLQKMKNLSSVISVTSKQEISQILIKLGFMRHDSVFFNKIGRQLYPFLHEELMDVNDRSLVLDQICNINHLKFNHLSGDDMRTLQNFFQAEIRTIKNNQDYKRKFRSLPLFETVRGERVRIDGAAQVFVLNGIDLQSFPDLFNLHSINSIFLKYNTENRNLSELMNITTLNDFEYFKRILLPIVQTLSEKLTFQCLKFLLTQYDNYCFNQSKTEIVSSMKTLKLIRSSGGMLETASYYFDDKVELYKAMVSPNKFVPENFWMELCNGKQDIKSKARCLIRDLGMKHEVSKNEIIDFAYKLEAEVKGNGKVQELREKSKLIFCAALNKKDLLLHTMADIKFIFPEDVQKQLCNYHQPFAGKGEAVKIRGSMINGDPETKYLIWTSMPVIHLPFRSKDVMKMVKDAGAHEQPPPQYVISNMKNICQSPCQSEELIKTRAEVFRRSYAYLQSKGIDDQTLTGFPVVLVESDKQLMKPHNVCLSLPNDVEFRPYLYKVPPRDVIYAQFFQQIGVKEEATAVQYCNVLADVHADSCDKQQLNPNQLMTVKRAVEQLFKLIKTQGSQVLTNDVKTLYLPAVDGKLHQSCSLYYNDTVFETKRVEEALNGDFLLLEKLSNCHLDSDIYEQHRLVQLLPPKFLPQMLSKTTQESMVDLQLCELRTNCDFSGWFHKHLSSGAFRHGLICLLRDQSQGTTTEEAAAEMCEKIFGSIQIVCCKTLKKMLCLGGEHLKKTTRETQVFVERKKEGCTFYLHHNDDMATKVITNVNIALTKEINALLGHQISSDKLLVLEQLLVCDNLEDVLKTLADNEIRDSGERESFSFAPPCPGTEIPPEWHDSLDMSFLNNFEEGEYVGYSIDNKYIYAIVVKEFPGSGSLYSRKYEIKIGEDKLVKASHLDIYQFKREKKPNQEERTNLYSMELQLLEGTVPRSSKPSKIPLPASLVEAKKEIDKCLSEIWSLPEEEKQKAIKRLYLKWHPDKNPDCQGLATEAFKYLLNRIDDLTKGKNVNPSNPSHSRRNFDFEDIFRQWNQEARYHRNGRERFSRGYRSYNFWSYNTNVPRPNKEEAQRWFKQAECDLNAARKDFDGGSTEWCLFKIHQAVEKALIAAEYKHNGQHPNINSISAIAQKVSHYHSLLTDLPQIVERLKSLGVDAKRTQYPNFHKYPHIPNGQFKLDEGVSAVDLASKLLGQVKNYVN